MAELTPTERLQPCLLDRLTDDRPDSEQESREHRVVSMRRFRQGVLRDLAWLLNTSRRVAGEHVEEFSEAANSVVNYGIPDLCGLTTSTVAPEDVERQIAQAIAVFEPRIIKDSITVEAVTHYGAMDHNAVTFEIKAELWAQPMPEQLYIKTEVDLETGQFDVRSRANG